MDKVVHFEIPFDDKKRAMKFYADAFDWKLTDMEEMSYVMAETVAVNEKRRPTEPGAINGGRGAVPGCERGRFLWCDHRRRRKRLGDRKSTRLNFSHRLTSRMPSSA